MQVVEGGAEASDYGSDTIAFIDVEASGLGPHSWPIEVGWIFATGSPRSMLIQPADNWSMTAWEKSAEKLHRISPTQIVTEGKPPLDTALVLNAALAGVTVYSDAPDYDSFWLFRLYDAAGIKPNYRLNDIGDLLRPIWKGEPKDLVTKATRTAPHTHRAGDDVLHLQKMYHLALESVGQSPAQTQLSSSA